MRDRRWRSSLPLSVLLILAGALLVVGPPPRSVAGPSEPAWRSKPAWRSSSAIASIGNGATLLVVNPDSNSLTLVDATTHAVIVELPVGTDPRTVTVDETRSRAYVANRGSASVSVVDLAAREVVDHVPVGQRPYGVVASPDGRWVYVAEQGSDRLTVLDADGLETSATVAVADRPSGLAVSGDGATILVTHLLSNTITVLDRAHVIYLPLLLRNASGAAGRSTAVTAEPARILSFLASSIALHPESNLVQSIVPGPCPPTGAGSSSTDCVYVPYTSSNASDQPPTFDSTVLPRVSVIDLSQRDQIPHGPFDLGTLDPPGVGLPFHAAVTPDGGELWVVNAASNDLTVLDLTARERTAHVEVGDNPRGIVLSPDGATAYVNNTLAGTVSVVDTAAYTVTDVITVTEIPLPPVLLNGKRLFHTSDDPRLARDQWISCNSCHFEGEHDGRTWFFGFSGPRNTTSLLGMIETYPLRWSGEWDESADSEYANREENFGSGLIDGPINCQLFPPDCVHQPPNQGRSYDLDSLAAYIDSLRVVLSPDHAGGEPLSPAEQRGQALFNDPVVGCATCHPAPFYTDQQMHDVGTATLDERIGPAYDTPSLRGLYDSAPYFHDGSAATLRDTLTRVSAGGEHDVRGLLTEQEIQDLIAFLEALPFAP
jgi:YVTN family beta-propeller protein